MGDGGEQSVPGRDGASGAAALSGRQLRFADEYLIDCNATRAYKAAGYKAKSDDVAGACAARLLGTARVAAYVAARQKKLSKKLEIDAEWVRKQLVRNHKRAHEGVPIVNGVGDVVGYRPDLHASNRAIELLGKDQGMFVERHAHEHTIVGRADRLKAARERARGQR